MNKTHVTANQRSMEITTALACLRELEQYLYDALRSGPSVAVFEARGWPIDMETAIVVLRAIDDKFMDLCRSHGIEPRSGEQLEGQGQGGA